MLVEADELCAVSTLLTQNRAAQERPEALLRKGVTDIRTASAPNSIKVSFAEVECVQRLSCRWHRLLFCDTVLELTLY